MYQSVVHPSQDATCPICRHTTVGLASICVECGCRLEPTVTSASPVLLAQWSRGIGRIRFGVITVAATFLAKFFLTAGVVAILGLWAKNPSAPPPTALLATALIVMILVSLISLGGSGLIGAGAAALWRSTLGASGPGLRRRLGLLVLCSVVVVVVPVLGLAARLTEAMFLGPVIRASMSVLQLLASSALVPVTIGIVRLIAYELAVPPLIAWAAWGERAALLAASTCIVLGLLLFGADFLIADLGSSPITVWIMGASTVVWLLAAASLLVLMVPLSSMLGGLSRVIDSLGRRLAVSVSGDQSA